MMKKLLLILFAALAAIVPARALETLTVCNGTNTDSHVPVYGYYLDDFVKSEFIIPATDLTDMNGGTISKLTWYFSSTPASEWTNTFLVFVKEVNQTTLSAFSGTDGATTVYTGTFNRTGNELTISLNAAYTYNGGNLLIGVYGLTDADYVSASFYGITADNGSSGWGYNGNSLDDASFNAAAFLPKTTFTYTPAGQTFVHRPTNLTVSDIKPNSATVTWTPGASETSWNFGYKKATDEQWTEEQVASTSYDLDLLSNGTAYDVRVQAVTADGTSEWTETQFQTPCCEESDMIEVSFSLTDSYGDGWNGNAIEVVNTVTGLVETTLTCPSGVKVPTTYDGTLQLCSGVLYNFVWVKGSYPDEPSFVFSDSEGEIFNCETGDAYDYDGGDIIFSYTPQRILYPRPSNLAASNVTYNSADLSWTAGGTETAWQIVYDTNANFDPDGIDLIPIEVTGTPSTTLTGLSVETTYYAYVRGNYGEGNFSTWCSTPCSFTTLEQYSKPTDLAIDDVKATNATASWTSEAPNFNVRYREFTGLYESFEGGAIPEGWTIVDANEDGKNWQVIKPATYFSGGLTAYDGDNVVMSRSYDSSGAFTPDNWLITPKVYLGGELSYWVFGDYAYPETYRIYVSTTGTDINDFEPLTGDLQSPSVDEWQQESFSLAAYAGQQGYIAFRNYNCYNQDLLLLDAIQVTGPESPWTVIENVTNPVTITNLNPETNYELQVQAAYSDGTSNWTKSAIFTTPNLIAMPEIVSIEPTVNSATITWKGAQDTYNLRYRKSLVHGGFFDDFESGALYGWTNLDEDGDGNKWYLYTPSADATDGYGNPYVFDHTCATSASYNGSALTPDNWLISPKVELKGTFSVWLRNQDPGYAETFAIYLSTTGTDPDDFTTVLVDETQAQSAYTEYTADLSEYNGQKGYIAIRHFNTRDMFRLNVDNFHVQSAPDTPAGEWVVVENVTYPYTIEGLDGDTRYDVEIQGIIDDDNTTEWTEIQWFETERAPMTLAEALAGKPGEVTITSDMKVMVSTTDFSSVTDGEGNWLIVFANDLAEGDVIANAQGIITLGANPMMTINSYDESEAIINVPDKRLDLANIHRESITELKSGEVLTFVGYYNAETGEICAFSPNTEYGGLHIGVSTYYMTGSIVEGKQQAFTAMAWLREAWDESETPNGIAAHAPARVAQDDDQAFENVMAYITAASVPTGIDAVKALDGKEIQGIYNVNGQRVTRPENGVYIIRYTDGTAAKVRF